MSHDSRPRPARAAALSPPVLLQCDRDGKIVWMSDRARRRLDAVRRAGNALMSGGRICPGRWNRTAGTLTLRYIPLPDFPGGGVIGIQCWSGASSGPEMAGLLRLQSSLLRNTMRLAQLYRRLDRGAAARNAGAGRRLVEQIEMERQRLGRELHTGVGQALAAIRLQVELAAVQTPAPAPETRASLDRIGALTAQALDQVRAVSHRLHPPEWQRLGIADALAQLWDLSGIAQKFEASLELESLDSEPPLAVKVLLYRTAQEALSNLSRHANATHVRMSLRKEGAGWLLSVEDNGGGFDLDRILHGAVSLRSGIGLRTIREQAQALDGDFRVRSGPAGTTLEVWLPACGQD